MDRGLTERSNRISCTPGRSRVSCLKTRVLQRDYNFCQLNFDQMYDSLGKNVMEYVDSERTKLRSMDYNRSSKLVNKVQYNLINFLKSKSNFKLSANKSKQQKLALRFTQNNAIKSFKIFDQNKLMHQLEQLQKMRHKESKEQGHLIQKIEKQVQEKMRSNQNKIPMHKHRQRFSQTSKSYMGFGEYKLKRKQKFIFG